MSQDCSSLDGSTIGGVRGNGDGDSHASLIPAPRSCTVSITSSFDNFNMNANDSLATTSSVATLEHVDGRSLGQESSDHHSHGADKDNLSVLESVGSHDDNEP